MHIEFRMPIVETIIQRERLEPLYQQVAAHYYGQRRYYLVTA
jgi:hypothetical protein